jgi:hypothetical protein
MKLFKIQLKLKARLSLLFLIFRIKKYQIYIKLQLFIVSLGQPSEIITLVLLEN